MGIQKVLWDSKIKTIKKGLDAKALAEAIKKTAFDKANEVARANQLEREKYTADYKTAMKTKAELLAQVAKRSAEVTDDKDLANLLKAAKLAVQEMAQIHKEITERNKEYGQAFDGDGFRQDLYKIMLDKEILKREQKAEVEKQLAAHVRERSDIMGRDIANNAEYTRVIELEKRGQVHLAEVEANAATGFKKLKNALTEKSDFKSEALQLIEEAWKGDKETHAKPIINNIEVKLKAIWETIEQDKLPLKVRVDRLILNVPDAEKNRKNLAGVVKTLKVKRDSLKRTYGEHDWNADTLKRVDAAIDLAEGRLKELTPKVKTAVETGVDAIKEMRQLLANE
jgi:hypothetical protein